MSILFACHLNLKMVPKSSNSTSNNFGIDSGSIFLNWYHKIQIMKSVKDVVKKVGRPVHNHPDTGIHSYRVGHQTFFS